MFGFRQSQINDVSMDIIGDAVPDPARLAVAIFEASLAECTMSVIKTFGTPEPVF